MTHLSPLSPPYHRDESDGETDSFFGGAPVVRGTRTLRRLSHCIQGVLDVATSVEEEFWLPFALRGAIYENAMELCGLAERGRLSTNRAADIVEQMEICCLFYKDLFECSRTLNLVAELAETIRQEKRWSLPQSLVREESDGSR